MSRLSLRRGLRSAVYGAPKAAGVTWAPPSSSIAFDGTNDYALTGPMSASIPQGANSVSWWMRAASPAVGYDAYIWGGPTGSVPYQHNRYVVATYGTTFTLLRGRTGVSTTATTGSTSPQNDGTWQHWCITCSATSTSTGDLILYVNGQAKISRSNAPAYGATADFNLYLARWGTYVGDYAVCNISELTVWDYQLSASQVQNLWNSGTPTNPRDTTGISTDPVHYWRMGSNMSNFYTVLDEIGNVSLLLYNGATTSGDVP